MCWTLASSILEVQCVDYHNHGLVGTNPACMWFMSTPPMTFSTGIRRVSVPEEERVKDVTLS